MKTQNTVGQPDEIVCLPMEDIEVIFSLWAKTLDEWCDYMFNKDFESSEMNERYLELCEKYTEYRKIFKN